jgi:hypothetical protein
MGAALRANSRIKSQLGDQRTQLLEYFCAAIGRLLPHVQSPAWAEDNWREPGAYWEGVSRKGIRVTISVEEKDFRRSLTCTIRRRLAYKGSSGDTLDQREHDICKWIAIRASTIINKITIDALSFSEIGAETISAIRGSFDEAVISDHIARHHGLNFSVGSVFSSLHTLSEQTYENKPLVFGCVLDPNNTITEGTQFPDPFLSGKKYKALSDGFKTAYHVSRSGKIIDFVDLSRTLPGRLSAKHYFPDWAEHMARVSRQGRCGIVLTRQGDILVFDEGTLRFTYRYGRWRYWNHLHVINLLRDQARAQRVPRKLVGSVVGSIYRTALDISFRRSGGLFVIVHNQELLDEIVPLGDAIGDTDRQGADREFDRVIEAHRMQFLQRAVAVELASLDGAMVLANSGLILAYGAILQPRKKGRLKGSEGSRTKAAIGASNYGLAIKISADGDITVYHSGKEFFRM